MKRAVTPLDNQRNDFIQSLHDTFKKQTQQAMEDQKKFIRLASEYKEDGLDDSEIMELLIIDGLNREAASCYINMVEEGNIDSDTIGEYSFVFEDVRGRQYSSSDVGRTITASSEDEAWNEAESLIDDDPSLEIENIVSVKKVN